MERIYAVIISYNGESEIIGTVGSVLAQVEKVIIVDNGSAAPTQRILEQLEQTGDVSVIRLPENVGIARAQNVGIGLANDEGADWVLTLDQDSKCSADMVEKLVSAARSLGKERVGFCCPVVRHPADEAQPVEDLGVEEVKYAISSGCLFPMAVLKQVGPQREDYFIDSVDFEYCLRLVRSGYQLFRVRSAVLAHKLGVRTKVNVLGVGLSLSVHAPFRRYYLMRNHIFLTREYWRYAPAFLAKKTAFLILLILQIVFLEGRKSENIRSLWAGLIDGLKGRGGKKDAGLLA